MSDTEDDGPARGHRKPPKGTQFKKGQSGNPRGRPHGAVSLKKIAEKVARRKIAVLVDGKHISMTAINCLLNQLKKLAGEGNITAARFISKLHLKFVPEGPARGFALLPETLTPEEWDELEKERMNKLNQSREEENSRG